MTQVAQGQIPRLILTTILDQHSIEWEELLDGSIVAADYVCRNGKASIAEWQNVTNWSMRELKEWLGY